MADSAVSITAGSGTSVDTRTATNGDHRQVMVPGGDGDYVAGATPYGYLRVNSDATGLFYDGFNGSTLDTTDRWTASGNLPAVGNGQAVTSATASTNNALWSKQPITIQSGMYANINTVLVLESAVATGAGRFFGVGLPAGSPSSTALVTDGAGWEIDATTGALLAVTYAGGTRNVQATITPGAAMGSGTVPNIRDGNPHRYSMVYRHSRIYWFIDGFDNHVATIAYPNLGQSQDMPVLFVRNNAASYTGTPVFTLVATGVGDMSRNGVQISDGTFNWRKAKVDANGSVGVSLGGSGGLPQTVGTISAAGANTIGVASTASTTGQVVANVALAGNVTFHLVSAAFVGTLTFEASVDGGLNYGPIMAVREDGTGSENGTALTVAAAFIRQYTVGIPGMTWFRVRASAYTSGTLAVVIAPGPFLIEPTPSLAASNALIGQTRDFLAGTGARTMFTAGAVTIALTATETAATVTPYRAGTAGTGATSMTVTAGKTLRIQSFSFTIIGSATATATAGTARIRMSNTTGASAASPQAEAISVTLPAIASNRGTANVTLGDDGLEIPAGWSFCLTTVGIASGTCEVLVRGYEF